MGVPVRSDGSALRSSLRSRELVLREYFLAVHRGDTEMASLIERASAYRERDLVALTLVLPLTRNRVIRGL